MCCSPELDFLYYEWQFNENVFKGDKSRIANAASNVCPISGFSFIAFVNFFRRIFAFTYNVQFKTEIILTEFALFFFLFNSNFAFISYAFHFCRRLQYPPHILYERVRTIMSWLKLKNYGAKIHKKNRKMGARISDMEKWLDKK